MKNSTKFYLLLSFFSAAFIVAVNASAPTPPNHFIEGWVTRYQHNAGDHANHNTWYGHYGLLTMSALHFIGGITGRGYGFANMLVYVIGFPLVSFVLTAFAFKEKPDWILPIITGFIGLVVCLGLASIDHNLLVEVLMLGYCINLSAAAPTQNPDSHDREGAPDVEVTPADSGQDDMSDDW